MVGGKKHSGVKAKIKILFSRPDRVAPSLRKEAENIFNIHQNKNTIDKPLNKYVVWQMIILLVALSIFILLEQYFSLNIKIAFALVTLLTLINCGAIMEQKRWVFYMEYIRLAVLLYLPYYSTQYWQLKTAVIIFVLLMITSYYNTIQKNYYRYVLK